MTITINTLDAKEQFAELINQVSHNKERIILVRREKEIAVIVSIEDYQSLLAAQDKSDLKDAAEALKEAREKGSITIEELKDQIEV